MTLSYFAFEIAPKYPVLRYSYHLFKLKSPREAYEVLPPFHFRVMWLPGATAGSLWSLGNVGSIVAVEHLGQGVR